MQTITTEKNETFNPLFAKMQERFCVGGTIAEKLAVDAGLSKKRNKRTISGEYGVTHGSTLPHSAAGTRALRKQFFSLKNIGALSMGVLLTSVLLLSGASFSGIHKNSASNAPISPLADTQVTENESKEAADVIYFAAESTPLCM